MAGAAALVEFVNLREAVGNPIIDLRINGDHDDMMPFGLPCSACSRILRERAL